MSYRKLEIWRRARELVIDIHKMTLKELPKFEIYEEGSQIRRSIKSTRSNQSKKNMELNDDAEMGVLYSSNQYPVSSLHYPVSSIQIFLSQ